MSESSTTIVSSPPRQPKKVKVSAHDTDDKPIALSLPLRGLADLPVELLYDILILSASPSFPFIARRLQGICASAPPSIRARYIISSFLFPPPPQLSQVRHPQSKWIFAHALHFPLCTLEVFQSVERIWAEEQAGVGEQSSSHPMVDLDSGLWNLPKRLFRSLPAQPSGEPPPESSDDPYHLLAHIFGRYPFNTDSHNGYPLAMAVKAPNIPLIRLLLERRANPGLKEGVAVKIAIAKRDLSLVRMLVERTDDETGRGRKKRRKLADRVEVNAGMLQLAVKLDARDIVQYLMEKGCVPDMKTLKMVR